MAALNEDVKVYIITALACYDSSKQVIADVREKFGLVVTSQQVSAYDPGTQNGKRLSKAFKELFATTREQFLKDASSIPIAQASYRLRVLDRLARKAEERGNANQLAQLLEQAAKESGGAFTNKHRLDHGGVVGSMSLQAPPANPMAPDEAYKRMLGGN
ncbi:MAG: DUF2280 domain-containing protein [Ramlibacter sp.]|nr:DUF2280 domain-containing protein [Ramlibacter sp.]